MSRSVSVPARPAALEFSPARACLLINDMQNAFCRKGGYLDLIGFDIAGAPAVIARVRRLMDGLRAAGVTVVHSQNGFSPARHEAPGPTTPIWHKSNALRYMRAHPAYDGKVLTHGTWDYEIAEELAPQPGDLVIPKSRDNGFAGTALDQQLRARRIDTVICCGISSNVGVESNLRAAYHLEYFAVMVADATMPAGPPEVQFATEFNVERFFGWVTQTDDLLAAVAAP